jgi:hypothetical protein
MDPKTWQIGTPLTLPVYWYDKVPEPPHEKVEPGEVIGWRQSQVLVRVPGYNVVRFWKKSGLEVGNPDHHRRGWKINVGDLHAGKNIGQDGHSIAGIDTDV